MEAVASNLLDDPAVGGIQLTPDSTDADLWDLAKQQRGGWDPTTGAELEEIQSLDLAYAPPFAPVWDPVLTAARVAARGV